MTIHDPDDTALLELGRLTWAAMKLEDAAYEVRRAVSTATPSASAPASEWITDGLRILDSWHASPAREDGQAWFTDARDALNDRNAVLHTVPGFLVTLSPDCGVEQQGPVLQHVPRRNKASVRTIALTPESLRVIRDRLEAVYESWTTVILALDAERQRLAKRGV